MAQPFDIYRLMVDDDIKDSACVNTLLRDIHSILKEREQLASHVDFDLNQKGAKDQKRWAKLLNYSGPDRDTLVLLAEHAEQWLREPSTFWTWPRPPNLSTLPAPAQIIGCFLETESDSA
ncbi:hypothetical protein OHC33_009622 [Knufia fluminis]|uniref:Uncharacterized protein n=1 Tax=Knufia fluminis TaxID=191047 RepID=A0AAN8E914_9EURO|nr:hypothetical protein OHC33_009622 [Knufia fluminis]